jgi:hypothetical protein
MKTFYDSLSSDSNAQSPYFEALSALNKLEAHQLEALTSELGWQDWWSPTHKPATNE